MSQLPLSWDSLRVPPAAIEFSKVTNEQIKQAVKASRRAIAGVESETTLLGLLANEPIWEPAKRPTIGGSVDIWSLEVCYPHYRSEAKMHLPVFGLMLKCPFILQLFLLVVLPLTQTVTGLPWDNQGVFDGAVRVLFEVKQMKRVQAAMKFSEGFFMTRSYRFCMGLGDQCGTNGSGTPILQNLAISVASHEV